MAQFLKNTDPRFHLVEARSKAFLVVVFAALLVVAGFAVWKQEWFRKTKNYYLIANTSEGLQQGMSIRTSGFRIGKVDEIQLEGPGRVRVDLAVFSEYAQYLRSKSLAKVRGENIIGDRFIEIQLADGAESSPELSEGSRVAFEKSKTIEALVDELEAKFMPIIDGLGSLSRTLPATAEKLDTTVEEATGLLTDLRSEEGSLMSGLANFSEAVGEVKELAITLRADDGALMSGIGNFNAATEKLNAKIGPLVDDLQAGAETLRDAAAEAKALFANANSVVSDLGDLVEETAPEVPGMVQEGADAVDKADDVIDSVRNMWPIRRGKKDQGEDILRTGSDD